MLSDDDREALRDSVDSLPPDDGPPWLFETVEAIVARHVTAALNEAARDECDCQHDCDVVYGSDL